MKISIRRRGGFAGLDETLAFLDSSQLPPPVAARLTEYMDELSRLCAQRPPSQGADQLYYEIETSEPGTTPRTLTVVDEGDPDLPEMKRIAAILDLVAAKQR
jgi:hypothetical protein